MSFHATIGRNAENSEQECRTCTDFKSWAKRQKSKLKENQQNKIDTDFDGPYRKDCPLDKNELGHSTWNLLHTIGATYPPNPTKQEQQDVKIFFNTLSKIYPCEYCAKDLREELTKNPPKTSSQDELSQWLCGLHNQINKKVGKPEFDCSKVNERWRDGWSDGTCN